MVELLDYLLKKETETQKLIDEIPEEFTCLEDSKNYNYYLGVLETITNIKKFIRKEQER